MFAYPFSEPACDCHVHVIGEMSRYPMLAARQYTPGVATVDQLRDHLAQLSLTRAVVVQPSIYGTDNRCTLDALAILQGFGRGVAVVQRDITDVQLQQMDACGIRGIRLNLESSASHDVSQAHDDIVYWSQRLVALGWHIQVYAAYPVIAAVLATLPVLPVPLVLDHFAMMPVNAWQHESDLSVLLKWLDQGRLYVKLSAPYRIDPGASQDVQPLIDMLVRTNPERLLWASDWPHTNRAPGKAPTEVSPYRTLPAAWLQMQLTHWFSGSTARRILVQNPATLYRF
jgi:predicted TIM-barrel fold metal-dependent hydrolase